MKTTLLIVLLLNIPTVNAICSAFLHASGLKPIGLGGEEVVAFCVCFSLEVLRFIPLVWKIFL